MKITLLLILSTITTAFCEDPPYPILQPLGPGPGPGPGGEPNETIGSCHTSDNVTILDSRSGLIDKRFRWSSFNVYIDPRLATFDREKIVDGFNELKKTLQNCPSIKFYLYGYGELPKANEDHVHVWRESGRGCSATIGRNGGKQMMYLWYNCMDKGTIMHEFLHALGMYHEHAIHYRERYVKIWWDNIIPKEKPQFYSQRSDYIADFGVPYNTKSIMHYRSNEMSANNYWTITDKNNGWVGTEGILQDTDKQKLRRMYNC